MLEDNNEEFEHLPRFDEFDKEEYDAFKVRFMSDVQKLTKQSLKLFNAYALLLTVEILCSLFILIHISKFDTHPSYLSVIYTSVIIIYSTIIVKILLFIKNDKKADFLINNLHDNKHSITKAFISVRMNVAILDIRILKSFSIAYLLLFISFILY